MSDVEIERVLSLCQSTSLRLNEKGSTMPATTGLAILSLLIIRVYIARLIRLIGGFKFHRSGVQVLAELKRFSFLCYLSDRPEKDQKKILYRIVKRKMIEIRA